MHNYIVLSAPQMQYWRLIEAVFLFAPAGVKPQQWHADTRGQYVGQNTVFQGYDMPTEFADLEYNSLDVQDEDLPSVAQAMDLPKSWASMKPATHWQGLHGRLLVVPFYTDSLHRGPSVPTLERVSYYSAWGPPGANTRRFVNEEFWNSLLSTRSSPRHPVVDRTPLGWDCIRCTFANPPKQARCGVCLCNAPRHIKFTPQTRMATVRKASAMTTTPTEVDLGGPLEKDVDTAWKNCLKNLKKDDNGAHKELLWKLAPFIPYFIRQCQRDTVDGQDPLNWYQQAPFFSFLFFFFNFSFLSLVVLFFSFFFSFSLMYPLANSFYLCL